MNAVLRIDSYSSDLKRVQFTLENIGMLSDSGLRISIENATLGIKATILESSEKLHNNSIFVLPGVDKVTGAVDISEKRNIIHAVIAIYAIIERKVKDQYKLVDIGNATISLPKLTSNSANVHSVTVDPQFVTHGEPFRVVLNGKPSSKVWTTINDRTYKINIAADGKGSITLDSAKITKKTNLLQHLRVYLSGEDKKVYDSGSTIQILPESVGQTAIAAESIISTQLEIVTTTPAGPLAYPSAGVGETIDNTTKKLTASGDIAFTTATTGNVARVNSFSVTKVEADSCLVALSSQDATQLSITATSMEALARIRASRVYVLQTPLGGLYTGPSRTALVTEIGAIVGDCADGLLAIQVDEDIWSDTSLKYIWILDGSLQGRKFSIFSTARTTPYIWYLTPTDDLPVDISQNDCFTFVPYGSTNATPLSTNLANISPLPQIMVDGYAVSAVNPQIAANVEASSNATNKFVYCIAEGNVDGLAQLFFYSFDLVTSDVFGWKQLTWNGENKNAKIVVDSRNNLHVIWESSRAEPGQVCYGVLGPDSRPVVNETFMSALDKQAQLRVNSIDNPPDSTELITPLVEMSVPDPLNLREMDEYGNFIGAFWTPFTSQSGGSVVIGDDGDVTCSGNPAYNKFASFATIQRDQNEQPLDLSFSQLSFQIAFDLLATPSPAITYYTKTDIQNLYESWKSGFTPVKNARSNVNGYEGSYNNIYTVANPQYLYDKIVPIAGSYKAPGLSGNSTFGYQTQQLRLRHFMLAIVPERVRFLAVNLQSSDEYVSSGGILGNYSSAQEMEYYTGKFRLALVTETSANISDKRLSAQYYHILRLFGEELDITESHSYRLCVHYSKLREEQIDYRANVELVNAIAQNVRFSGDIFVVVDDKVQGADTFVPDFSDGYEQFDIGLGVTMLAEYRPFNIKPLDGTINHNINITLQYTNIAIGPHTVTAHPTLTSFALADRNVSAMYIGSSVDEFESMAIWEEVYGEYSLTMQNDLSQYLLGMGLDRFKIRLSQIPVTFSGRNSSPAICLDNNGQLHIAYQSNRDGNWEIYYTGNFDPSLPFRFDTRITDDDSDSLMPSIGIDKNGHRLIVWHDNRSGNFQIYAARSLKTFDEDGACTRMQLTNLGLIDNSPILGEYEYLGDFDEFASICQLRFTYTNITATTKNYHFIASFYFDQDRTSFVKMVDSRFDITNWNVSTPTEFGPMPYNGVTIAPGETVEIFYDITQEDDLTDSVYHVAISSDDGFEIKDEKSIEFFCPVGQSPLCHVPVLYSNQTEQSQNVHFRVTVYSDSGFTNTVLSADTSLDQRRWRTGTFSSFPSTGLPVTAGETISVAYNPDILPMGVSQWQNATTIDTLLCNTKYYVKVESYVGVYEILDTFAFQCDCDDVENDVWRTDNTSKDWTCSGQGGSDIRITSSNQPSLYPQTAGSQDGMFYIVWEDLRGLPPTAPHTPSIYFTVWDANQDVFYSKTQGFFDTDIIDGGYFRPQVLVSDMQQPSFVFTDGQGMFRRSYSLYVEPPQSSSSSSLNFDPSYLVLDNVLALTTDDFAACIGMDVYQPDVVRLYHQDSDTPVALVGDCRIRLDVRCPHGTYAVRFKNEIDANYSDWIPVLPKLYGQGSSSSTGIPIVDHLQAYSVSDSRFISDWILSPGNGNKVVSCEIMTFFGQTPEIQRQIIARYQPLSYRIKYFTSGGNNGVPASMYNGYPVVSTKSLQVVDGNVGSILSAPVDTATITIQVEFDDPEYLSELLALNNLDRFTTAVAPSLTFNVIMPGQTLWNLPLTAVANTTVTFDYTSPPTTSSAVQSGVFTGTFPIAKADGFNNQDGLAVIVLNIPTPCTNPPPAVPPCAGARQLPSDIQNQITTQVAAIPVTLERFRYAYNPELLCSFTSNTAYTSTEPVDSTSLYVDDATFPPTYAGSVSCELTSWTSSEAAEPCYFLRNELNSTNWFNQSPEFELDFSDPRIDYLKFDPSSILNGILILVHPNDQITFVPTLGTCLDPNSSSSSVDGTFGRSVTFTVPSKSIIFKHTVGPQYYYCHGPSECNLGSAKKIVDVASTQIISIPEGSYNNTGTDGGAVWGISNALGVNFDPLSSVDTLGATGCLLTDFTTSVAKQELINRGFVTSNGVLQFKLIHIYTGTGYAKIVGMTCGAACEDN